MATGAEVRTLLRTTTMPTTLVHDLVEGASPMWLLGEPAEVIAADLALCHPALADEEVRASVHQTETADVWRLSVVAHDRRGLLARTASALSTQGLSIQRASVTTWPGQGLALQRVFAHGAAGERAWESMAADLRVSLSAPEIRTPDLAPQPPVKVAANPHSGGRTLVRINAPDRVGLLWAIAAWLAEHDCNIEVARVGGANGAADDTFIVEGTVDAGALAVYLSGESCDDDQPWVLRVARDWVGWVGRLWPLSG